VVRLLVRGNPPADVRSEALFFRVVRAAFSQRRKTLANALAAGFAGLSKPEAEAAVAAAGFDKRVRGEALDIPGFAALSNYLADRKHMQVRGE
jgi:16S rRNA (adenine1518-N6/adenine1519-N6)-dimethyltransferase